MPDIESTGHDVYMCLYNVTGQGNRNKYHSSPVVDVLSIFVISHAQ